jgi:hypothetical protein
LVPFGQIEVSQFLFYLFELALTGVHFSLSMVVGVVLRLRESRVSWLHVVVVIIVLLRPVEILIVQGVLLKIRLRWILL